LKIGRDVSRRRRGRKGIKKRKEREREREREQRATKERGSIPFLRKMNRALSPLPIEEREKD
jgi:hypothetical protein